MEPFFLYSLAVFIVFTALSIVLIRKFARIYLSIIVIFTVCILCLFAWVFLDVKDIKNNFQDSSKVIFLNDKDEFISGLTISPQATSYIKSDILPHYAELYREKNYETLKAENYKLMIISLDIVNDLPQDAIAFNGITMAKEEISKLLAAPDPAAFFPGYDATDDEIKAALFSELISQGIMNPQYPLFFFEEYKKGAIFVYPETAVFKIMRFLPLDSIKSVVERFSPKVEIKSGLKT
jgi:hypothetical protein